MIDAGHRGYDVGSISNFDDYEKDINLDIALLVGKQLKSYGYNVVYTHTSDSVSWLEDNIEDLQTRCDLAKKGMPISLYRYIQTQVNMKPMDMKSIVISTIRIR